LAGFGASGSEDVGAAGTVACAREGSRTKSKSSGRRSAGAHLRGAIRFSADRQVSFVPIAWSANSRILSQWELVVYFPVSGAGNGIQTHKNA
jgi:hypothetical protein